MRLSFLNHLLDSVRAIARPERIIILGSSSLLPEHPALGGPGQLMEVTLDADFLLEPITQQIADVLKEAVGHESAFEQHNATMPTSCAQCCRDAARGLGIATQTRGGLQPRVRARPLRLGAGETRGWSGQGLGTGAGAGATGNPRTGAVAAALSDHAARRTRGCEGGEKSDGDSRRAIDCGVQSRAATSPSASTSSCAKGRRTTWW